ncbi:hypothetical protein [Oenococcus kitaharae]|uniref:Uncharacterized protein n=1 Tax=Oenococcus kitaharae DSM 17330 TaxID=1045004 RepID=G9WIP4_9LACO|nr:hypothetical protein [Oenococcus kitaharae]EHN58183.1 hypothetical protein OKIT_0054 [Oenococcus kitaharae DSM 17330]
MAVAAVTIEKTKVRLNCIASMPSFYQEAWPNILGFPKNLAIFNQQNVLFQELLVSFLSHRENKATAHNQIQHKFDL